MRPWGYAAFALSVFTSLLAGAASAQNKGPVANPPAASGSTGRRPSPTVTDNNGLGQRPIFISGTVVLSDGTPLIDRAKIERVCNGTPRTETYTDKKGRFSFEVGHSMEMPDASVGSDFNAGRGASPFGNMGSNSGTLGRMSSTEQPLLGCELRAELPGFRSDILQLNHIRYMDNPEVGTIVLHRLGNVEGLTISVVSALAPKEARKFYEKGLEAVSKHKPEEAEKYFEKAVELYPKYSVAWFETGKVYEQSGRAEDARKAYQQAISAEPKFIQPQERLAWMALSESKWQELVDVTAQWLRLDALNSPSAYYLSSIGNLQTKHFDVAEKNAREAVRLDPGKKNMRTRYILGLALAQNHDYAASAEAIRTYLKSAPDTKDSDVIRKQLEQIEEAARETAQAKPE